MKRILLTGGGSGGHIFPLLAVAQQLKKNKDVLLYYLGARDEYNAYLLREGIEVSGILSAKLRRYFSLKNFIDAPKLAISIVQAFFKVLSFKPDIVFSKGGPGALPVVLVSRFLRIPVVIHESDSVPGLTNKISGRFAQKIFLSFESAAKYFKNKDIQVVGNPIREELLRDVGVDSGLVKEQLITVLGGSQGSTRINQLLLDNLQELLAKYQIIHQVGGGNYENYQKEYEAISREWSNNLKNRYQFFTFLEKDYSRILAASDLIIARAGAGIFEIAAFGKPAILITLPEAANNHQELNSIEYSKTGAAVMIKERDLGGEIFLKTIDKILGNTAIQQNMQKSALAFAKPDAAKVIAVFLNNPNPSSSSQTASITKETNFVTK